MWMVGVEFYECLSCVMISTGNMYERFQVFFYVSGIVQSNKGTHCEKSIKLSVPETKIQLNFRRYAVLWYFSYAQRLNPIQHRWPDEVRNEQYSGWYKVFGVRNYRPHLQDFFALSMLPRFVFFEFAIFHNTLRYTNLQHSFCLFNIHFRTKVCTFFIYVFFTSICICSHFRWLLMCHPHTYISQSSSTYRNSFNMFLQSLWKWAPLNGNTS